MRIVRFFLFFAALIFALFVSSYLTAIISGAQTLRVNLRPDYKRALRVAQRIDGRRVRQDAYQPARVDLHQSQRPREKTAKVARSVPASQVANIPATAPITSGTRLSRVLHTAQISLTSTAGTHELFVDRNQDLIADERTTFDFAGGSFDIAVGGSGSRYEVYSATLNNRLIGVLVVALDTNGDFVADQTATYDLQRDFGLPSAAAVVAGSTRDGREFVVVSSSGYYNPDDPNDPNNEPSPGVVLLVRDPLTGGFDQSRSRQLVSVGDNRLFNANGLALLPNNEVLIADFRSNELRIIRDTNGDGLPDMLDPTPYYSYQFSDDHPLDIAVNSRGVVFSHSVGNSTFLLAIYDDNRDGRADRDEVVVEGLSIDNNLILHGLTVDSKGTVYVIEDAASSFDGSEGNGGIARIDAFPDANFDGFLSDGSIFSQADFGDHALSGLGFAPPQPPQKMTRNSLRKTSSNFQQQNNPGPEVSSEVSPQPAPILILRSSQKEADSDDETDDDEEKDNEGKKPSVKSPKTKLRSPKSENH